MVDREQLIAMQRAVEDVHVSESIGRYIVALVGATRESASVQVGASPRGTRKPQPSADGLCPGEDLEV